MKCVDIGVDFPFIYEVNLLGTTVHEIDWFFRDILFKVEL